MPPHEVSTTSPKVETRTPSNINTQKMNETASWFDNLGEDLFGESKSMRRCAKENLILLMMLTMECFNPG